MLRSMNELIGYRLLAKDKDVGKCKDLLFDDQWWTVRHLLADTGGWLIGNQVLVSPLMIEKPDWQYRKIRLNITKETLEDCPSPSVDEPVSREQERQVLLHYGYPYYWADAGLWGPAAYPQTVEIIPADTREDKDTRETDTEENHLRSFNEVKGYSIKAEDGDIGHVQDFILDDETWAMRYLIVDTRNWLPGGKKVMLSLNWARSVDWAKSAFEVDLLRDQIENGPEFDPEKPVNVEMETRLYDYYGRPFEKTIDKQLQQTIGNPFL